LLLQVTDKYPSLWHKFGAKAHQAHALLMERKIWHLSPVVKTAPAELKARAFQRMNSRLDSGEQVKDIAADLRVSSSALYRWVKEAGIKKQ